MRKKRKKSRQRKKRSVRRQRDVNAITKIDNLLTSSALVKKLRDRNDEIIDDRRRWRPDTSKSLLYLSGLPIRYRTDYGRDRSNKALKKPNYGKYTALKFRPNLQEIENPRKALICKKRSLRRIMLFKLNKVGKGKKTTKNRKFRLESMVSCKRR